VNPSVLPLIGIVIVLLFWLMRQNSAVAAAGE